MSTLKQIRDFQPRTKLQEESKEKIIRELEEEGASLYERESLHGHMTASAIILNPGLDKTLMIYHNIYKSFAWTGGHSDGNQDLYQVARIEAMEETGIKNLYPVSLTPLSVEALPVAQHMKKGQVVKAHEHYNVTYGFICSEKEALKIKPDENSDVKWLEIDRLDQYCSEKEMIPIYLDNIHHMKNLMAKKERVYQRLPGKILPWYEQNARDLPWRQDQDPYHVWISEIMLQQTRVETVRGYYERFLATFPTVKDLAQAEEDQVLKLWEGLGYYSRARNLHKTAKIIEDQYQGIFPRDYKSLLALPGIGSYTAGALASISFNLPKAAVDGNVLRLTTRLTEDYRIIDDESTKKAIAKELEKVYPKEKSGDFTQSLIELGATICLPNGEPLCSLCPLEENCLAKENKSQKSLPVRKEKARRKEEDRTIFVFHFDGKIALEKRKDKGLLQGLWQLPNLKGHLEEKEVRSYLEKEKIEGVILKVEKDKHIFTHIQWNMICYHIECSQTFGPYSWANEEGLQEEYTIPTAFRKFIED